MRIYAAYFAHESNSFSPVPTSLDSFREFGLYLPSSGEGSELLQQEFNDDLAFIRYARERGHEVIIGPLAGCTPSAPMPTAEFEFICDEIVAGLKQAGVVDAVMLFLHGAQLAQDCDDCEGRLIARLRDQLGPDIPMAIELDLHCCLSDVMVDKASIIVTCLEYPHTDFAERGLHTLQLLEQQVAGDIRPTMAFTRVPMLGYFFTNREPLRSFVDQISAQQEQDGVLSISLCHGFGLADSSHTSASVLVICDDAPSMAQMLADQIAERFFALREQIKAPLLPIPQALDQALAAPPGLVVIADTTDNSGGGAASDSTFILAELLRRGIRSAAVALLWDVEAVSLASRAGIGAETVLRIGGKTSRFSGAPLEVTARVKQIRDDVSQKTFDTPTPLGLAVLIEVEGIDIVINSIRQQVMDPACFTEMGVDLATTRIAVVKSTQHFYASFKALASRVIYADGPGSVSGDFAGLEFQQLQRPMWPIDQAPFTAFGRSWAD